MSREYRTVSYQDVKEALDEKCSINTEIVLVMENLRRNISDNKFTGYGTHWFFRKAIHIKTKLEFSSDFTGKSISWNDQIIIDRKSICRESFKQELLRELEKRYKEVEVNIYKRVSPNEAQGKVKAYEITVIELEFIVVEERK